MIVKALAAADKTVHRSLDVAPSRANYYVERTGNLSATASEPKNGGPSGTA